MTRRGEFELIAALFAPLARHPGALGLRDDTAFLAPRAGNEFVLKIDTVIAGVHFRGDDPPDTIARKALRVNLSDLAAKGATPVGVLQALTLPADTDDTFLERYTAGLAADLDAFGIGLLGGDTTAHRVPGAPLTISFMAVGEVPAGQGLLRSGARPGDLLCVSGTIGDAAFGLRALEGRLPPMDPTHVAHIVTRYRLPAPRLALGAALRGIATACLDISDGLCADVGHLCTASGVQAQIKWTAVPRSPAVDRRLMDDPGLRALVLGGGDDYELAFAVPPDRLDALADAAARTDTPVAVIGQCQEVSGDRVFDVIVRDEAGQVVEVPSPGYTHR